MYEACFRVSLKHASLWAEIFRKLRLKGWLSYLHMYLFNTCRTAANRILRSTSTIPTARKRCCFWVRGLTLFFKGCVFQTRICKTTCSLTVSWSIFHSTSQSCPPGYRLWINGLFMWHKSHPELSLHLLQMASGAAPSKVRSQMPLTSYAQQCES